MCELTLYRDCDPGSITVSNYFIDEYLADANDCQIKVYLYLIRMLSARRLTNISDIADMFNHTEKDVCRALRYWEKKGILSLDYDSNGGIVGIRLHEPVSLSRESASGSGVSGVNNVTPLPVTPARTTEDTASFNKPSYSASQLKEFKQKEETAQLIFVAEQYLKKTLTASDIRSIMFYSDELCFSPELIDHLLQFCIQRGKHSFAYMDKVAIDWAEHGIDTVRKARDYTSSFDGESGTGNGTRAPRPRNTSTARKTPTTMFHQFEQNDYDFGSLEKKLLSQ